MNILLRQSDEDVILFLCFHKEFVNLASYLKHKPYFILSSVMACRECTCSDRLGKHVVCNSATLGQMN